MKGAVLALPFLTTFMDKVATFSLVDGISMQVDSNLITFIDQSLSSQF